MNRKYGWVKQPKDDRDLIFGVANPTVQLPAAADISGIMPPCYDQLQTSSCIENSIAGAIQYYQIKDKVTNIMPSRLFMYYNVRSQEGDINEDNGGQIRDGLTACNKYGVVSEELWQFTTDNLFKQPTPQVYAEALKEIIKYYAAVSPNLQSIKTCIVNGDPIIFGTQVFESLESPQVAQTGILNMPEPNEQILGGHCVSIYGFDDNKQYSGGVGMFKVRNSWGTNWGENGYFWLPYTYITNGYCSDFSIIKLQ